MKIICSKIHILDPIGWKNQIISPLRERFLIEQANVRWIEQLKYYSCSSRVSLPEVSRYWAYYSLFL